MQKNIYIVYSKILIDNFRKTIFMPNIQSAKKALRQNNRRREMNLYYLTNIRNLTRDLKKFVTERKTKEAKVIIPKLYKFLDKAAKHGTIKKNTAARKKSRLTKLANSLNKK